jgi:hypothetical protein
VVVVDDIPGIDLHGRWRIPCWIWSFLRRRMYVLPAYYSLIMMLLRDGAPTELSPKG